MAAFAALVMGIVTTAQADELWLTLVPNPHGQFVPMYRSSTPVAVEPTIGLSISNQGPGNNIVVAQPNPRLVLTRRTPPHGPAVVEYWRR